jgi:very-short-patch-repair endonuclease
VTSVARMVLDLAEQLAVEALVDVIDRCESKRLYQPDAVADVVARSPGRRGLGTLRRAQLIARPQDVLTRSELERRALRLVAERDLQRPEVNTMLHGYEVDLLWRHAALVVELDGRAHHGDAIALDRDHRRDANLQAHGFRVLRFTWRQVTADPGWVGTRITQLLQREGG